MSIWLKAHAHLGEATTNQGQIQLQVKLSCLYTITKDNMLLESSRGPAETGFQEDAK